MVRYQVAAPLSVVFAALGVILFGARTVPLYGGFVKHWQDLLDFPEMIQEGLVWPTAVIIGWQLLSLYFRIPVVQNLGFGKQLASCKTLRCEGLRIRECICIMCTCLSQANACIHALIESNQQGLRPAIFNQLMCLAASAILGTLVVYPGSHFIDWGTMSSTRPYLSGLGPIYLSPFIAILLTIVFVAAIFLPMRSMLFRSEDPFHTMLWVSLHSMLYICAFLHNLLAVLPTMLT